MANALSTPPVPVNEPVTPYTPGSPAKKALKAELERQGSIVVDIPAVIGGKRLLQGKTVELTSPHDHKKVIARVYQAGAEDAKQAVLAAETARKEWAALPWEDRASVFLKAADLLATKYRPIINASTMIGQSKTAHQAEIDATCELIDFFRFNVSYLTKIYGEQPQSGFGMWNRSVARGLEGFVYAITPFNFTSIAANLPAAPALMGCSVIWKPAPTSMHSAWVCMQLLEEAGLPPGVINFLPGDPEEISSVLLNDAGLAGIHFTGSTATFNYLWSEVGKNIGKYNTYPRIVGETGGKDFIFAHASADPAQLTTALVRGAFEYQGQKCSAASRAYIPKRLWDKIKNQLVSTTQELKMGDVSDFTNFVGAVIDRRSFDKITGYIDHAQSASNAQVIAGGEYDASKGYFIRPTIIETSDPKYKSMTEEIFGPVLTVYPYDDDNLEATLELCDTSTKYALTGAIFGNDRVALNKMMNRLEHAAGNFYINDKPTGAVVGQQPFGGSRGSGTNDKAGSMFNLLRWTSHRTIKENFLDITDYKYPYMGQE